MEEKIVSSIGGIRKTGQSHAKKKLKCFSILNHVQKSTQNMLNTSV